VENFLLVLCAELIAKRLGVGPRSQ